MSKLKLKMNKFKINIFFILILIFYNVFALSEEINKNYINIEANTLVAKQNQLELEFIGNVYANDEVNFFWGDKLIIYYDENKKIKLMILENNVKIKRVNQEAMGNFASYNPKKEIIEMVGDVSLIKDGNVLNGEKLTIDLISSTSIIEGSKNNQVSVKIIR